VADKKGRWGGKRHGSGRKPEFKATADNEIAARVLVRANEEESIIEVMGRVKLTDPRLWWDMVREHQHQARGKPIERRVIDGNLSVDIATRRQRVEEMLLALVE
jgi:hypothetical protein